MAGVQEPKQAKAVTSARRTTAILIGVTAGAVILVPVAYGLFKDYQKRADAAFNQQQNDIRNARVAASDEQTKETLLNIFLPGVGKILFG